MAITPTQPRALYTTIKDNIIALLNANLTDLNYGLLRPIDTIMKGDPFRIALNLHDYPAIMVQTQSKMSEPFVTMNSSRKDAMVNYNLYCVNRIVNPAKSDDEIEKIADNVEAIFRDNVGGVAGAGWVNPSGTEFGVLGNERGVYVSLAIVTITAYIQIS